MEEVIVSVTHGKILHLSLLWENAYYGLVFGNIPQYARNFRNLGRFWGGNFCHIGQYLRAFPFFSFECDPQHGLFLGKLRNMGPLGNV
jgi:hypothetical protein